MVLSSLCEERRSTANSFAADRKRISSFCFFVVLYRILSFFLLFCHFLISHFVIFLLSLIRERRGALLFDLNEECAAKVIAADSSHLTVLFFY